MDMQKCTQKSLEAIKAAQNLAIEYSNLQIDTPHLALSLIHIFRRISIPFSMTAASSVNSR